MEEPNNPTGGTDKSAKSTEPTDADPYVDRAVEDILHHESDELLSAKDEEVAHAFVPQVSRWQRMRNWVSDAWSVPKYRYSFIAGVSLTLVLLLAVPPTRYFIFNTFGARASVSVSVTDDKTTQPIKNATVEVAGKSAKTNEQGIATIDKAKLGPTTLQIKKTAYASVSQRITLGLGKNDIGSRSLASVGSRIKFRVVDWLSKQPLKGAEANIGESNALANEEGVIELPVEPTNENELEATLAADHYISKQKTVSLEANDLTEVALVIDYPNYFVSNRTGKYDLYRVNTDGTDEKIIFAGTGKEVPREIELSLNNDRSFVAYISRRDNEKNADGYLFESLTLIDSKTDVARKIASSEDIYVVGWDATHLIYVKIAAGTSAANPSRQRLISYDLVNNKEQELASSNYFINAQMAKGYVFYTPSDIYKNAKRGIYRVRPDGTDKLSVFDQDTWAVYRSDYDQFTFQTPDKWYKSTINKTGVEKLDTAPSNPRNMTFVENNDFSKAIWLEERDGKGTLLLRDTANRKDTILRSQSGLSQIVGWAGGEHVIYRVVTPSETADYILNINGGDPAKIKDVFNAASTRQGY